MTFINSKRERIKEIMESVKKSNPSLYKQITKAEDERLKERLKEYAKEGKDK